MACFDILIIYYNICLQGFLCAASSLMCEPGLYVPFVSSVVRRLSGKGGIICFYCVKNFVLLFCDEAWSFLQPPFNLFVVLSFESQKYKVECSTF